MAEGEKIDTALSPTGKGPVCRAQKKSCYSRPKAPKGRGRQKSQSGGGEKETYLWRRKTNREGNVFRHYSDERREMEIALREGLE